MSTQALKQPLGAAVRISADALTGTIEGAVVDPYKNILLHDGEEGYSFHEAFEEAGGSQNVRNKTMIAGVTSAINESADALKAARNISNVKKLNAMTNDVMSNAPTEVKTNALGQEVKIWEVKDNGKVTQKIVQGPTGKTTQFEYKNGRDIFGNQKTTTYQRTFDAGTNSDIGLRKVKVEVADSAGNLKNVRAYDVDGKLKYKQDITTNDDKTLTTTTTRYKDGSGRTSITSETKNGNITETTTTTNYKDGSSTTNNVKITETTDPVGNITQKREVKITNKDGGTIHTELETKMDQNKRKLATSLESTKNLKQNGDGKFKADVTYDTNGNTLSKNIEAHRVLYGNDGKAVVNNGTTVYKDTTTTITFEDGETKQAAV